MASRNLPTHNSNNNSRTNLPLEEPDGTATTTTTITTINNNRNGIILPITGKPKGHSDIWFFAKKEMFTNSLYALKAIDPCMKTMNTKKIAGGLWCKELSCMEGKNCPFRQRLVAANSSVYCPDAIVQSLHSHEGHIPSSWLDHYKALAAGTKRSNKGLPPHISEATNAITLSLGKGKHREVWNQVYAMFGHSDLLFVEGGRKVVDILERQVKERSKTWVTTKIANSSGGVSTTTTTKGNKKKNGTTTTTTPSSSSAKRKSTNEESNNNDDNDDDDEDFGLTAKGLKRKTPSKLFSNAKMAKISKASAKRTTMCTDIIEPNKTLRQFIEDFKQKLKNREGSSPYQPYSDEPYSFLRYLDSCLNMPFVDYLVGDESVGFVNQNGNLRTREDILFLYNLLPSESHPILTKRTKPTTTPDANSGGGGSDDPPNSNNDNCDSNNNNNDSTNDDDNNNSASGHEQGEEGAEQSGSSPQNGSNDQGGGEGEEESENSNTSRPSSGEYKEGGENCSFLTSRGKRVNDSNIEMDKDCKLNDTEDDDDDPSSIAVRAFGPGQPASKQQHPRHRGGSQALVIIGGLHEHVPGRLNVAASSSSSDKATVALLVSCKIGGTGKEVSCQGGSGRFVANGVERSNTKKIGVSDVGNLTKEHQVSDQIVGKMKSCKRNKNLNSAKMTRVEPPWQDRHKRTTTQIN